jgi:hypothetical protein
MKKIIYFITAVILMTACCGETPSTVSTETTRERIHLSGYGGAYNLYRFTYRDHVYIMIKGTEQMAIEHDPDCPCKYNY